MFNRIVQVRKIQAVGLKIYGIEIRRDTIIKSTFLVIQCGEKEISFGFFK